jgi:hypothetical protein
MFKAFSITPLSFLQLRDRDSVKDALQQVLPKFKSKVNKELEERHRLLSENPPLLQLYKDLVISLIFKTSTLKLSIVSYLLIFFMKSRCWQPVWT